MTEAHTDILIRIRPQGAAAETYPVEARLGDGSVYAGELALDQEALLLAQLDPHQYGLLLFNTLFTGRIRDAYNTATGLAAAETQGRLRVRLQIDDQAAELHAIPWERLYHIHRGQVVALAASALTPFSRYTELPQALPGPIAGRPIHLLFAVANPRGLPAGLQPVAVEQEIANLQEALGDLVQQGQVQVTLLPGHSGISTGLRSALEREGYEVREGATSLNRLLELLPGHHAFHLVAHGDFQPEGDQGGGTAVLHLEGPDGSWQAVRDTEIVPHLAQLGAQPHLIFLAACESAMRDGQAGHPFTGLAPRLVQAGIPAVVAMQDVVPVELARQLTRSFYGELLEHGLVDRALNVARNLLFNQDEIDWAIPVLFMRLETGELFAADPVRLALQEIQHWAGMEHYLPMPIEVAHLSGSQELISQAWFRQQSIPARDLVEATLSIFSQQSPGGKRQAKLVLLVGSHGTAKTTQLRAIARSTAGESLSPSATRRVIPVLVDLTDYAKVRAGPQNPIEALILENLRYFWPGLEAASLADLHQSHPNLVLRVLLDGSDDLPDRQRREAWLELGQLLRAQPHHEYMLAIDWANYDPRRLRAATDLLVIQPLSPRTIQSFLMALDDVGPRLYSVLERTQLFDLAAIPWLLSKMVAQARADLYPRSRTEVLQGLFEDGIAEIAPREGMRARAAETLYELGWEMQAARQSSWPVEEVFRVMDGARRGRGYSPEALTDALVEAGLLAWVGRNAMRFAYPAYQTYCAAMYIHNLPTEARDRALDDVTACLGRLNRLRWWEGTLVLLSGLMRNPNVLLRKLLYGATFGEGDQVFVAVRCLMESREQRVDPNLRDQVVDALAWRMDSINVRISARRARAAQALGKLQLPATIPYLTRMANQRVRINQEGELAYELTGPRMAAATALRWMMPRFPMQIREADPGLAALLDLWVAGDVPSLIAALRSGPTDLQPIAAFALGDLQTDEAVRALVAAFRNPEHRASTRWAVAEALTLVDPARVTRKAILPFLDEEIAREDGIYGTDAWKWRASQYERLAYLIGKIRTVDPTAREFLNRCLFEFRSVRLKARAIQSLGWLHDLRYKERFEKIAAGDLSDIAPEDGFSTENADYLRQKAIEALANIGDQDTLARLREGRAGWTRELEQAFYETSEEISWRMGLGSEG